MILHRDCVLPSAAIHASWVLVVIPRLFSARPQSKSLSESLDVQKVKVKVTHTRLPSVGFRSSQPAGDVTHKPGGRLQLPPQPLRGLLPILLLGEQRHNGCEQFA